MSSKLESRRQLLRYLATSPLLAHTGFGWAQESPLSESPDEAINVFDFHEVAKRTIPVAHYGYIAGGTDDDGTVRANRKGFEHFELRVRRRSTRSRVRT